MHACIIDAPSRTHAYSQPYVHMHALLMLPHVQVLPDSLRGCIVGLSALAPNNDLALFVNFGSASLGIPSALSRIFNSVSTSITD